MLRVDLAKEPLVPEQPRHAQTNSSPSSPGSHGHQHVDDQPLIQRAQGFEPALEPVQHHANSPWPQTLNRGLPVGPNLPMPPGVQRNIANLGGQAHAIHQQHVDDPGARDKPQNLLALARQHLDPSLAPQVPEHVDGPPPLQKGKKFVSALEPVQHHLNWPQPQNLNRGLSVGPDFPLPPRLQVNVAGSARQATAIHRQPLHVSRHEKPIERALLTAQWPIFANLDASIRHEAVLHIGSQINKIKQYMASDSFAGRLLCNLLNAQELKGIHLQGIPMEGMLSAAAIYAIWQKLDQVTTYMDLTSDERLCVDGLLKDYEMLFYSSVLNKLKDTKDSYGKDIRSKVLDGHLDQLIYAGRPVLLHSGFEGHTAVTRLVMSHAHLEPNERLESGIMTKNFFTTIADDLGQYQHLRCPHGDVDVSIMSVMQTGLDENDSILKHLRQTALSQDNYLIRQNPSDKTRCYVEYKDNQGTLKQRDLSLAQLKSVFDNQHHEFFAMLKGKRAIPNSVKMTVHDAGAGRISDLVEEQSKTFDMQFLLPLKDYKFMTMYQLSGKHYHKSGFSVIQQTIKHTYGIVSEKSMHLSPLLSIQHTGNCTVYSQKLALMYGLQHAQEIAPKATTVDPEKGLTLARRIWRELLVDAKSEFLSKRPVDDENAQMVLDIASQHIAALG